MRLLPTEIEVPDDIGEAILREQAENVKHNTRWQVTQYVTTPDGHWEYRAKWTLQIERAD